MTDLQQFVADKTERPGGLIEPIPTFTAYEAFAYSAAGMRSPFDRPIEVVELATLRLRSSVAPERNRAREFLEQFGLDSLSLVGRVERQEWSGRYCVTLLVVFTACVRAIMSVPIMEEWSMLVPHILR